MALLDINAVAIVTPSWDADYVFVSVGGTTGPRKALFNGPANCVFATPDGEAGAPTFRELVPGDMPSDLAGDNETVTIGDLISVATESGIVTLSNVSPAQLTVLSTVGLTTEGGVDCQTFTMNNGSVNTISADGVAGTLILVKLAATAGHVDPHVAGQLWADPADSYRVKASQG